MLPKTKLLLKSTIIKKIKARFHIFYLFLVYICNIFVDTIGNTQFFFPFLFGIWTPNIPIIWPTRNVIYINLTIEILLRFAPKN